MYIFSLYQCCRFRSSINPHKG